jgi:adhesin HecA-like repeat protein
LCLIKNKRRKKMGKLTKGKGILGVLLTVLMICALLVPALPVLAADTSMSTSPTTQTVNPGDSFNVDVVVDPGVPSLAAQFNLSFDASLVQVDSVTEGTLYSGGGTTYFIAGTIDNDAGTVTGAAVSILGGTPITDPGAFITIHMTAETGVNGTSPLTLSGVIVSDENAQAIAGVVVNNGGVVVGTGGTPPTVTTNAASDMGDDAATLNGTLDALGTASSVDVSFEWGTTTTYGSETTPQTMTSAGAFSAALSGLNPGTTYHFRAKAVGDGTSYGSDMSFVTTGEAHSPVGVEVTLNATILTAVSISVEPSSIDFGELVAGVVSDPHTITITNLGGTSVDVTAEVTGDSLFIAGLWLDTALWDFYAATILEDGSTTTDVTLNVPGDYTETGSIEGTLTFWAEVTP